MAPIRIGLAGGGWRAEFFMRIIRAMPERYVLAAVAMRDSARAKAFAERWNCKVVLSLEALAVAAPDIVVLSVAADAHLPMLTTLSRFGLPVLCETPPARDLSAMLAIWKLVEKGFRLQIAEQYLYQPLHAARLAVIAAGRLGRVTSARVSVAHGYHGVSLMRKYLGIGFEDVRIRARTFGTEAVEGPGRFGPPQAEALVPTMQTLGEFDFGDRLGLFDFTDVQYRSPVHSHHVVIRGTHGEIADLTLRSATDFRNPTVEQFERDDAGHFGDLDGYALRGIRVGAGHAYRNPFPGARLMDDEIAIATALEMMVAQSRGEGPGPYSFAEGAQDQYLSLLMAEAAATGEVVASTRQPWAG